MPTTKGETRGLPQEEEGLLDVRELKRLIRAARAMAVPAIPNQKALADAMTKAGRPTFERRAYDFESGRVVPSAAELFLICAVTRPPGGLAHFAPAFPKLWPTLEADLVRTPRISGVSVEPVRAFFAVCDECGEVSPVMDNVRYPGPRLDSMLREWVAKHKETHGEGEQ